MAGDMIERARLLIQQKKYSDALAILYNLMIQYPGNVPVLTLMAELKIQLNEYGDAEGFLNQAIGVSPDFSHLHYLKSYIMAGLEKYDDAEKCLAEAIRLDPYVAEYFAYWAYIKNLRKKHAEALELADQALAIEPENILGLNARSTALLKLNNKEESFRTIEGALREDPDNPFTHTNYGWNQLEKGNHKQALKHFMEALKQDPNLESAKAGIIQSLKAKNIIYRGFLKYAFWMGNMGAKYQWGVIIGFYLLFRFLRTIALKNEAVKPFLTPLLVVMGVIAFSTWIINPISNLFLRFNMYGRHTLNKKEKLSSNLVAVSLLIAIVGAANYFLYQGVVWVMVAVYGLSMMIPLGIMFAPAKKKNLMVYYTLGMAITGFLAILVGWESKVVFNLFSTVYIFALIGFQWIANYILIKRDNL